MTEEQIKQKFKETYPDFMRGDEPLSPYFDVWEYGIEIVTKELQEEIATLKHNKETVAHLSSCISDAQEKKIEKAKELLTRFVMASVYFNGKETDLVEEAEQFLKETK